MSAELQWPSQLAVDERAALRRVPIFADLDDAQLGQLAGAVERRHIAANEWLFRQGELSDAMYIVDLGRFVAVDSDGHMVAEMASGDSIGDLGVIAGSVRSADVRALRDSVVWRIEAKTFRELLGTTPHLQTGMLQTMARMLQRPRSVDRSRRPRVVGVLSTGDATADPIVEAIADELSVYGLTAIVAPSSESTSVADHYEQLVGSFSATLDEAELCNDWVLLVAERGCGDLWRRYVVSQSDRLIVLGAQHDPPELMGELVRDNRPIHLVTCTAEPDCGWWDLLQPASHHPGSNEGLAALARRIAGRSLGLVLAGGGARGLAHFGVYEELGRAGVVIDRFGGTSAGAIAAAVFALGMTHQDATAAAREFIANRDPLGDYTIPAVAFTRGGRVDRLAADFFGETVIEHLPKAFFSVSADLITGDQIVHRRGKLSLAVRASVSIPGLVPPVQQEGQLLVDGGLLNNLPADVMCADRDGDVICVDLRRNYSPSRGFGVLPPMFRPPGLLRRLVTGVDAALPPLQETLLRTVDLAASSGNPREMPHVVAVIEPDVSDIGLLNFKQIDAAVEVGRQATRKAFETQPELMEVLRPQGRRGSQRRVAC